MKYFKYSKYTHVKNKYSENQADIDDYKKSNQY